LICSDQNIICGNFDTWISIACYLLTVCGDTPIHYTFVKYRSMHISIHTQTALNHGMLHHILWIIALALIQNFCSHFSVYMPWCYCILHVVVKGDHVPWSTISWYVLNWSSPEVGSVYMEGSHHLFAKIKIIKPEKGNWLKRRLQEIHSY